MGRNRSGVGTAPVVLKSLGLKFVTGTPTATVPRMSDPVIRTFSGSPSACAVCAGACAWAEIALAIVNREAVPKRGTSCVPSAVWRGVVKFMDFSPDLNCQRAADDLNFVITERFR